VAEIGWRARGPWRSTLSLTAFHHRFQDLRTLEPGGPSSTYHIENGGKGRTSGVEGWAEARFHPDWRLVAGFVAMSNTFELQEGHVDLSSDKMGNNPRRTAVLRSLWNVTPSHELDVTTRYVSALPNPAVPAYTVADLRAGWRVSRELDLSLIVRNVFNRRHAEAGAAAQRALFGRGAFLRLTWAPR
jgi:iron complex outermembrane receptor protein